MTTWIEDAKGNLCSVEYFGSREAAQKALDSLIDCENCTNCSNCSGCSRCSNCSRCSDCSNCSRCSDCSGCSGCSRCSDCSDCSGCSNCSDCSLCSSCSGCSNCSNCSLCSNCSNCSNCSLCSNCSNCSNCSRCSRCSNCSGCSHIAWLVAKENLQGDPDAKPGETGQPPIPKIENIDLKVYEAASKPDALDMGDWHTCSTTHCRAGWVVHLAGEAGYALERFHNTQLAAQLIYRESGSPINPAKFWESNEAALADMKKRAGVE